MSAPCCGSVVALADGGSAAAGGHTVCGARSRAASQKETGGSGAVPPPPTPLPAPRAEGVSDAGRGRLAGRKMYRSLLSRPRPSRPARPSVPPHGGGPLPKPWSEAGRTVCGPATAESALAKKSAIQLTLCPQSHRALTVNPCTDHDYRPQ